MAQSGIVAAAPQIAAISAFLGGFSATLLGTLLFHQERRRLVNAGVVMLAFSASAFIVCSIAATLLFVDLQPGPGRPLGDIDHAQRSLGIMNGTFVVGMITLLGSIALCGWLRSRRLGLLTSGVGAGSLILIAALLIRTG